MTETNYSKHGPCHHCVRQSYKTQKCVILRYCNSKKNVTAFTIKQNANRVLQSAHSKVGMLAARFPQGNQIAKYLFSVSQLFSIYFINERSASDKIKLSKYTYITLFCYG